MRGSFLALALLALPLSACGSDSEPETAAVAPAGERLVLKAGDTKNPRISHTESSNVKFSHNLFCNLLNRIVWSKFLRNVSKR